MIGKLREAKARTLSRVLLARSCAMLLFLEAGALLSEQVCVIYIFESTGSFD